MSVEWCVMQCVAVCCSVLQCVAVCCIELHRSSASHRRDSSFECSTSQTQHTSMPFSTIEHAQVVRHIRRMSCCSVLQCVAVCCSVLQCVAVCCSVLQCVAVCCSQCDSLGEIARHVDVVLQRVVVCCSHCSVLQCVTVSTRW